MIFQLNKRSTVPVRTPDSIRIGDSIKINFSGKERTQIIQGTVLAYHKSSRTIKVRRIFQEVGFERIFSLYSPQIQSINIIKRNLRFNTSNKRLL